MIAALGRWREEEEEKFKVILSELAPRGYLEYRRPFQKKKCKDSKFKTLNEGEPLSTP